MTEGLATDLAKTARGHFLLASRTMSVVLVVLLLFHLLTFDPYLRLSREIAALQAETEGYALTLARLEGTTGRIEATTGEVQAELDRLLNGATIGLVRDFGALQQTLNSLRRGARGLPSEADLLATVINPAVQRAPIRTSPRMEIDDPAIVAAARSGDDEALAKLIVPYVGKTIIEPAYSAVAERWEQDLRPRYLKAAEQARAALVEGAQMLPGEQEVLATAIADLDDVKKAIEAVTIDAGTADIGGDDYWWSTVERKRNFAKEIAERVRRQLSAGDAVQMAQRVLRASLDRKATINAGLRERRARLEEQFAERKLELTELGGLFSILPFHLTTVVALFPLLIGLGFALTVLWVGRSLRELTTAAGTLPAGSADAEALRSWTLHRIRGPAATLQAMLSDSSSDAAVGSPVGSRLPALTAMSVLCGWIVVAQLQLSESPIEPRLGTWGGAAAAIVLVLVAGLWLAAVRSRTERTLADPQGQ